RYVERGLVAGRRPRVAGDHGPVGDQDEESHRERREQRGQLQPQPARREAAAEELELRPPAATEGDQGTKEPALIHLGDQLPAVGGVAEEPERQEDPDRDAHDDPEDEQPLADDLGDLVEALSREVPRQDQPRRPEPRAEDAEGREVPVRHLAAAGYERREGANQPDEAADQDRPAAVT